VAFIFEPLWKNLSRRSELLLAHIVLHRKLCNLVAKMFMILEVVYRKGVE
ncbi:hypothetical protein LOAG_07976, partial [Loa loa]